MMRGTLRFVVAIPCAPVDGKFIITDVTSSAPVALYLVIDEATEGWSRSAGGRMW